MPDNQDFSRIFERLKTILFRYEASAVVTIDGTAGYSLDTPYSPQYRRALFFGSVKVNKNYVSFYLMPVYMFPDLLESLSPELKQRMQGKSCFNFKKLDEPLFLELEELTHRSVERMHQEGIL